MARRSSKHPTEAELEILKVLWEQGPCTIKQVQDALAPHRSLAYTTLNTTLTIMINKGYVRKRRTSDGQTYEPRVRHEEAAGNMLRDLVERLYDGSTLAVVQQLLDSREVDAEELAEIRRLIQRKSTQRESPQRNTEEQS